MVAVQRKVFDLLLYLIENRDRAVDKNELQDAIWPGTIVTETALTRAIMKARRAAGDDAVRQHVVKTVHGHGYRFVAQLLESDAVSPVKEPIADPQGPINVGKQSTGKGFFLGGLTFVLLAVAVWFLYPKTPVSTDDGTTIVAVLPVKVDQSDLDLEWTRLGLMGFLNRLLSDNPSISVISPRAVLSLMESSEEGNIAGLFELLGKTHRVTHVVAPRISRSNELLKLDASLITQSGETPLPNYVDENPTTLAKMLSEDLVQTLSPNYFAGDIRRSVSDDPIVNQAFSKGLQQELTGNLQEAKKLFEAALVLEPDSLWPRYEHAIVTRLLGENQAAETALLDLLNDARNSERVEIEFRGLNALGITYLNMGRYDEARAKLLASLDLLEKFNDPAKATSVLVNLGIVAKNSGNLSESRDWLQKALAAFQQSDIEVVPGHLYNALANLDADQGDLGSAKEYFSKALESFQVYGQKRHQAAVLNNLAWVRTQERRFAEALLFNEQSLELREQTGDRVGVVRSLRSIANLHLRMQDHSKAEAIADRILTMPEIKETRDLQASALRIKARVAASQGDYQKAEALMLEAMEINRQAGKLLMVVGYQLSLGNIYQEAGRLDQAKQTAEAVLATATEDEFWVQEAQANMLLGDIELASENHQGAAVLFRKAQDRAAAIGNPPLEHAAIARQADLFLLQNQLDKAEPLIAVLSDRDAEHPETLILQARLAHDRGRHTEAFEHIQAAKNQKRDAWEESDEALYLAYSALISP